MKRLVLFTFILLLMAGGSRANAPAPQYRDPGAYVYIHAGNDLGDYSFFLVSGDDVRQVKIVPDGETTVSFMGIADKYAMGTIYAIPTKNLTSIPSPDTGVIKPDEKRSIIDGREPGMIKLIEHRFFFNRDKVLDDLAHNNYRLERSEGTVTAIQEPRKVVSSWDSSDTFLLSGLIIVVAFVVIVVVGLAIIIFGIWFFVRRRRKENAAG